jgi:hypothetical protein
VFSDNFETDTGWTAENLGASSGDWQRGVPVDDDGWDYDPESDSDGSGQCYLTQNQTGNTDVDGGAVRLTSPSLDLSAADVRIAYDYFLRLTDTDGTDRLLVEINTTGGTGTWTEVARHDTNGGLGWRHHEITSTDLSAALVTPTADSALRFTANDGDAQSIVEAGLDAFEVTGLVCDDPDGDADDVPDIRDNCPDDANPGQDDADGDETGDACDLCMYEPALVVPEGPTEINCTDLIDNDCDGLTDGADGDCGSLPCTCGDVDRSGGAANMADFAVFANCYGLSAPAPPGCTADDFACSDLDANGAINLADFGTFALMFGLTSTETPPNCAP